MSAVDLVRKLDEASKRVDYLDLLRREIRLGRNVGQTKKTGLFVMLKGVYGGGWLNADTDEPVRLSNGLQNEFYSFLTDRLDAAGKERRDIEAEIRKLDRGAK